MTQVMYIRMLKRFYEGITLFLVDVATVLLIFKAAVFIRVEVLSRVYEGFLPELSFRSFTDIWWVFVIWLFFMYYEGIYEKRVSFWEEIWALWKAAFYSTVSIFVFVSLGKLSEQISRTVVILMGALSLLVLPLIRLHTKKIMMRLGFLKRRTLILGAGQTGELLLKALQSEKNYGYEVIGFLDDDPEKAGKRLCGIRVHRGVNRTGLYVKRCNISDVFIAMPGAKKEKLKDIINGLQHKVERLLIVPEMFGVAVIGTELHHFFNEQAFVLELKNNLARLVNIIIKKVFDILLSLLILPLVVILLFLFAIIIIVDSRGPVIFSQERMGKRGKLFKCFKFRTMHVNADKMLPEFFRNNPCAEEEWGRYWKLKDDPRITRFGRFLRSTSLDELPQIFNVLKGEMSLVGPRPYLLREKEDLGENINTILLTRPGITGLWQVSGRNTKTYDHRIALDLWYVRNWNIWLDIIIILKTFRVVLSREGAC
jgi:undecaprenyl-phosphate galactose phosphotransferase